MAAQFRLSMNTVMVTSGDYTCGTLDRMIFVNQSAAVATTIWLPLHPTLDDVVRIKDMKGDAATHHITVAAQIDGQPNFVMNQNYQGMEFRWNTVEWSAQ